MVHDRVILLTGFSGSGKDSVAAELNGHGIASAVPHTTRPMRTGEVEGNPYFYVDKGTFDKMISDEQFIEYNSYKTLVAGVPDRWYYGTSKAAISKGTHVLTTGVQSAFRFKEEYGDNAVIVFIHVPDSTREERAKGRGSFDQTEWDNRLSQDRAFRAKPGVLDSINFTVDNTGNLSDTVKCILENLSSNKGTL